MKSMLRTKSAFNSEGKSYAKDWQPNLFKLYLFLNYNSKDKKFNQNKTKQKKGWCNLFFFQVNTINLKTIISKAYSLHCMENNNNNIISF